MLSFFYDFFLLCCFLPKIFFRKYWKNLLERLTLKNFDFKIPKDKNVVLIHAVSLGETKAARGLIEKIKEKISNPFLIITSITLTGHQEAKKLKADLCLFLPLDFSFIMRRFVNKVSPKIVCLIEGDFWFHFLKFCKAKDSKIFLVSGKISTKSSFRFSFIPFFTKKLFSYFDLLCVQDEKYKERFKNIEIKNDKITVTGNLKYSNKEDDIPSSSLASWKKKFNITENDFVVTLASTHFPEERDILKSLEKILKIPRVKAFVIPRHPENFQKVKNYLNKNSYPFTSLSAIYQQKSEKVIVIDTMGFLPICYTLSHLAIVGGSFKKIGGHNILEPIFYKTPVIFGPQMFSQQTLTKMILKYGCGIQVSLNELSKTVEKLLTNKKLYDALLKAGKECINSLVDSLDQTLEIMSPFLKKLS